MKSTGGRAPEPGNGPSDPSPGEAEAERAARTSAADHGDAPAAAPRRGRLRRALRLSLRVVVVLLVSALLARVSHPLWLPGVVDRLVAGRGLSLTYDDLDLSLSGGRLELRRVRLTPRGAAGADAANGPANGPANDAADDAADDAAALAVVDYVGLDLDVSALLVGSLRVHRAELDGVRLELARDREGTWNFERYLAAADPADPANPADPADPAGEAPAAAGDGGAADADEGPAPLELGLPLQVAAAVVHGVRVHVVDEASSPRLESTLALDLAARDLGYDALPARVVVSGWADELLDALRIEAVVRSGTRSLDAAGSIELTGIGVGRMASYLAAVGVEPTARSVSLEGTFDATLMPLGASATQATGGVHLGPLVLRADGEEAFALDAVDVRIGAVDTRGARIEELVVDGVRGRAARGADGVLELAGLRLVGGPAAAPDAAPSDDPASDGPAGDPDFALAFGRLALEGVALSFRDEAVVPAADLGLSLAGEITDLVLDPARPGVPLGLRLEAALADVGRLVLEGVAVPTGATRSVELVARGEALTLAALRGYLAAAGLEPTLSDGRFELPLRAALATAEVSGGEERRLEAALGPLRYADGDATLAVLEEVALEDLRLTPGGDVHVGDLTVRGGRVGVEWSREEGLRLLGLRTVPPVQGVGTAATPAPRRRATDADGVEPSDEDTGGAAVPPLVTLDRLRLEDLSLSLDAPRSEPALDLDLSAGLTLSDFAFGGDPAAEARGPARLEATLTGRDLVDRLALTGEVRTEPGPLDVAVALRLAGEGLRADGVAGLLAGLGLESELVDAALQAELRAEARRDGDVLRAEAAVLGLELTDRGRELVALDELRVEGVALAASATTVDAIVVRGPRLEATRDEAGVLGLLGLRLVGAPPAEAGVPGPGERRSPGTDAGTEAGANAGPPGDTPVPAFALGSLDLQGARIAWRDRAVAPAVDLVLEAAAGVEGLDTGPGAAPATLRFEARVEGVARALRIEGRVAPDPAALLLELALGGEGLRAGPLASYLPVGVEPLLEDGRLEAALAAEWTALAAGGNAARLELSGLALRDGDREWLAADALRLVAPRLDPAGHGLGDVAGGGEAGEAPGGGVYDLEALVLEGLRADVRRTEAGLELLGLRLVAAPEPEETVGPPAEAAPAGGDGSADATAATGDEARPAAIGDADAPVGAAVPPTVRLGALDVGIARLAFRDERAGGVPLELSLGLSTDAPQLLCAPDPEDLPPIELRVRGAAAPLADGIRADLALAPFAPDPHLTLEAAVAGLHGGRLPDVLPGLAASLDASELSDGILTTKADATLRLARRGPVDFDLTRGFGVAVVVSEVALRPTPEEAPSIGFERLDVDVQRVQPATGEVRVRAIELTGSYARVRREPEGLRVAGILLRSPEPADAAEAPSVEATGVEAPEVEVVPEAEVPSDAAAAVPGAVEDDGTATPAAEQRVDELRVTGLEFLYEDTTVDPPLLLPITDLELEVRGLSSRVLAESRSVSFRLNVEAGEVPLRERTGADHLLVGVLGSMADAVTFADDEYETELRRVWDQLELTGRLALFPLPTGRIELTLAGFELPAVEGPAAESGVAIGDGLVDTKLSVRLRGEQGVSLTSRTTFDVLSISEPPNGPISQYLRLPAPLDTVLFLLRNDDGQQEIPLRVSVPAEGASAGAVATAAATALGTLIADALASAPARLLGPLTDIAGAAGFGSEPPTAETASLPYAPGTTLPSSAVAATLGPLVEALRADPQLRVVLQHELGSEDVARVDVLANPDPARSRELVTRLRDRKAALARERGELSALLRALYAVGSVDEAGERAAELRRIDRESLATETALDRVLELMRPGAERRRAQRTRVAALALARERMRLLEQWIVRRGGPGLAERLDVRRPRFPDLDDGEDPPAVQGVVTLTPRRRE